jgi:hypothetical protein
MQPFDDRRRSGRGRPPPPLPRDASAYVLPLFSVILIGAVLLSMAGVIR